MNSFAKAEEKTSFNAELMGQKRQEKALREFKEVLQNLVFMLGEATGMETVYLYWINRARRQFVMETKATNISEVVFRDRVGFEEHFLDEYKDIKKPLSLLVGKDINPAAINHYYGELPVRHITLLPFLNNDETVAITVIESKNTAFNVDQNEVIHAYSNALGNVLNTYLEMSDLYESQNEWIDYEESLSFLNKKGHYAELLKEMVDSMQAFLQQGGVSLIAKGMGIWTNVLNATAAYHPAAIGMPVEERSVAQNALNSGAPEFAIHFNRNPKRLSPRELYTGGATLAIPLLFNGFRKALVLVHDENPLIFKESTKHKLVNIARLTALKIQAKLKNKDDADPFLTNSYEALLPDLWERAIDTQIQRIQHEYACYHSWAGMITLTELSQIRTQFRLDELNIMQKDLARMLNPAQFGIPGFIGFHADYIYLVFIQSKDPEDMQHWVEKVRQKFRCPLTLSNGKQIESGVNISFEKLDDASGNAYKVVSRVKKELSP